MDRNKPETKIPSVSSRNYHKDGFRRRDVSLLKYTVRQAGNWRAGVKVAAEMVMC